MRAIAKESLLREPRPTVPERGQWTAEDVIKQSAWLGFTITVPAFAQWFADMVNAGPTFDYVTRGEVERLEFTFKTQRLEGERTALGVMITVCDAEQINTITAKLLALR